MTTHSSLARRILVAGGFAFAASAAPLVVALATPGSPASPLAQCPPNEVLDPNSGACRPITDQPVATDLSNTDPIAPGATNLQPGSLTESSAGNTGQIPEINGIPCEGDNTGLCMGLQMNNPANTGGVTLPQVPVGVQP
jgi:hypothetical protein